MFRTIVELLRREDLLSQALEDSYAMLRVDREMFEAAVASLRTREDADLDYDVYEADRQVNRFEQEVRRKVLKHLTLSEGLDVNAGLVLVSIVIDIERIGDFTKNIVDLAIHHPTRLQCGGFEERVRGIEDTVRLGFAELIAALPGSDIDTAREIMARHWQLSSQVDSIVYALVEHEVDGLACPEPVAVALYIRYLKRISAHLMNIASSVVNPFERIGFRADGGTADDAE